MQKLAYWLAKDIWDVAVENGNGFLMDDSGPWGVPRDTNMWYYEMGFVLEFESSHWEK